MENFLSVPFLCSLKSACPHTVSPLLHTDLSGLPSPSQLDGTSLVPVLKDSSASVKTAALTQHPRPALYWGGGPQALPQVMGYALKTDRGSYHGWRDFKTGHVVGQELYD